MHSYNLKVFLFHTIWSINPSEILQVSKFYYHVQKPSDTEVLKLLIWTRV